MTPLALGLILFAAVAHAVWNLHAKRVDSGLPFVFLFSLVSVVVFAPFAIVLVAVERPRLDAIAYLFILGSAAIHVTYFLTLQQGYRRGDLSVVYPVARGSGPLLAMIGAILLFAERPSAVALAGAAAIAIGVFVLAGDGGGTGAHHARAAGVLLGLATGAAIATYTLWDAYAVSALLIPPLILDWGSHVARAIFLAPTAWRQRAGVADVWTRHRREVLVVAVLSPLAYILVLVAFTLAPVSYVAPAREVSILIGVALGARYLREGRLGLRLGAAACIVGGIAALALG